MIRRWFLFAFLCLPATVWAQNVPHPAFGFNLGPYTDGSDPDLGATVSQAHLQTLMTRIAPYTQWYRTFGCTAGLAQAADIARQLGKQIAVGAWLGTNASANQQEVDCAVALANAGKADLLIVGSEVLRRGDLSEVQLIGYVNGVKSRVQNVPVTTAEIYGELIGRPNLLAAVDVVLANYYPFWEGKPVDQAIASVHEAHKQLRAVSGKEVWVSESGWPSQGGVNGNAVASLPNAVTFFKAFVSWADAFQVKYFYFEAFDEPFKVKYEGAFGAHWGVWDKNLELKPGMEDVFNGNLPPPPGACGPGGAPAITLGFVPPYGATTLPLSGSVANLNPDAHKVAVYIQVAGGWWTKPTFASPLTPVLIDCTFSVPIVTGGSDAQATAIAAFVLPNGVNPPIAGGGALPAVPGAVASVQVTRTTNSISGRITDGANAGVAGVSVALSGAAQQTAQSSALGYYSFYSVGGGNYAVTPSRPGLQFSPANAAIQNLSGAATADFRTLPCKPAARAPADGAGGIALTADLMWLGCPDAASYEVYLGTTSMPGLVATVTGGTYSPAGLAGGTTYYWRIVAVSPVGRTSSDTFSFTTRIALPASGAGLVFVPLPPCRVADTRLAGLGAFGSPNLSAQTARTFPLPSSACGVPSTARAYSLNVTVVPLGTLGYLALWPGGQPQPSTSVLNSWDGSIVAAGAIIPAGQNGAIHAYATDATHLILDINGYFADAAVAGGLTFFPLAPCRVFDSRLPGQGPTLQAGERRTVAVNGRCGAPAAAAYSLNFTVVPAAALGYLTTWPSGSAQPFVSTLNAPLGGAAANAAIVPANGAGAIDVFVTNATDVIIDINGYFAPSATPGGSYLYPLTPCRIADTRFSVMLNAGETRVFDPASVACGIPQPTAGQSITYVIGATVVPPGLLGYLSLWPGNLPRPIVSTLNAWRGQVASNMAILPGGINGAVSGFVSNASHLILDINAYFAR